MQQAAIKTRNTIASAQVDQIGNTRLYICEQTRVLIDGIRDILASMGADLGE